MSELTELQKAMIEHDRDMARRDRIMISNPTTTEQSVEPHPNWELSDLLHDAVFVVEASSFERQVLWERWAKEAKGLRGVPTEGARVAWIDQSRGWLVTVANLRKRPVCISIFGALVNDCAVLFYEATSEVVDWKKIKDWFRDRCWPMWDSGTRRAHCDAMNFHHCLEAVRQWHAEQAKESKG